MKKILVVGTSGSGKSTLAKKLSEVLNVPYTATDSFYWRANWQLVNADEIGEQVRRVIQQDSWILDGNFIDERNFVWAEADTLIWLDLPKPQVLFRVLKRNLSWVFTQEVIWSGNKMTLRRACSGVKHAYYSYDLKQRTYPDFLDDFSHLTVLRFKSSNELNEWLNSLNESTQSNDSKAF